MWPLPRPVSYICVKWKWSHSVVSDSLWPIDCTRLLRLWDFPGKSTGWGGVAISFSRGSFQPRYRAWVSHAADGCFTVWATSEAPYICRAMLLIFPALCKSYLCCETSARSQDGITLASSHCWNTVGSLRGWGCRNDLRCISHKLEEFLILKLFKTQRKSKQTERLGNREVKGISWKWEKAPLYLPP